MLPIFWVKQPSEFTVLGMLMSDPIFGLFLVLPEEQRFYKALGERIADFRRDRDLTQQQIADGLGIPQQTFGRYELGQSRIAISLLPPLAALLKVSVPELLGPLVEPPESRRGKKRG